MFWRPKKKLFQETAILVLRLRDLKSEKTRIAARLHIGRLIKNFGELPIGEITETDWAAYITRELAKKKRTFFDDRKYMRMILRHAWRGGLIAHQLELAIPDLPSEVGREIEPHELRALRKHAGPTLRFQIEIARRMGLRLREMMRLRWDQFDWEKFTIRLLPGDTKTRRGRLIAVPPDLMAQFKRRRAKNRSLFVFPTRDGSRPQGSNKTAWRRCKAKAGVRARWHDWRHTAATVMLRRGVDPEVARRYLGMSRKVFDRIYTHLSVEDLRKAAAVMSEKKRPTRLSKGHAEQIFEGRRGADKLRP